MRKILAEALVEFINNTSGDYAELREDYSGRNMYGDTTTGIIVNNKDDITKALLRCPRDWDMMLDQSEELAEAAEEFDGFRTDSMCHDTIVY